MKSVSKCYQNPLRNFTKKECTEITCKLVCNLSQNVMKSVAECYEIGNKIIFKSVGICYETRRKIISNPMQKVLKSVAKY